MSDKDSLSLSPDPGSSDPGLALRGTPKTTALFTPWEAHNLPHKELGWAYRLSSNLVAELSAPRLLSPFFLLLFLALLGGFTTTLFTTSGIKASTTHVPSMRSRLGRGVLASYSHLSHSELMYPPAVHPESFGIWRLRTTSTTSLTPVSSGPLVEFFRITSVTQFFETSWTNASLLRH